MRPWEILRIRMITSSSLAVNLDASIAEEERSDTNLLLCKLDLLLHLQTYLICCRLVQFGCLCFVVDTFEFCYFY